MEALQRALSDRGLSVSMLPEKGRCLFTTRDFRPGEVIVRDDPYVWVPDQSSLEPRCDGCLAAKKNTRCSACRVVWYCGIKCQKKVRVFHRLECAALSKLTEDMKSSLTPFIRLMVRLCIRRKLENENVIPATAMENYELVKALMSHMSDMNASDLEFRAGMANLVNLVLQWPDINIEEITENLCKLMCNEHAIFDHEWTLTGQGLFLVISMINHSCLPNSVLVFEGKSAVLRATQHIAKDSEVLIGYIDTAGSTLTRQKALKERYFFTCKCVLCIRLGQIDELRESAIREGYHCENSGCDGFLLPGPDGIEFICQLCGLVRSNEEINEIERVIKSLSDYSSTFSENNLLTVSIYMAIEKLQVKLFHRFSIRLMQTREKVCEMFMDLKKPDEALPYCRLITHTYQRLYPEFHPFLGLQYHLCGKIEQDIGDTENAVKSLTRAFDILRVLCGTDTSFMKKLLLDLVEVRNKASGIA